MDAATIAQVNAPTVLEICAGGGGQAVGLEAAGFAHAAAVEIDAAACATLRANRPHWNVIEGDVREIDGRAFPDLDLLAGGVPCPPFSIAGKQLGADDVRDMFPTALRLVREAKPKAVLLENVPGFASAKFAEYRNNILLQLVKMGYVPDWRILNASDYGVPQLRPRCILVAVRKEFAGIFAWPQPLAKSPTVGEVLYDLMAAGGWPGAPAWKLAANGIGPTIVGGSKKHGGPDLGPTRARKQWASLGVDGISVTDAPPGPDFPLDKMPRLTVAMVARIQGFSDDWKFVGRKTAAYRQVGNAFPPPVAAAVGRALLAVLQGKCKVRRASKVREFQLALPG
jgi:DNA (cytosine-5)-methyltransferase 1